MKFFAYMAAMLIFCGTAFGITTNGPSTTNAVKLSDGRFVKLADGRQIVTAPPPAPFIPPPYVPLGTGTTNDPYQIWVPSNLVWMANNVVASAGKFYLVMTNINANGITNVIGTAANNFFGDFNGNNKTISNLTITGASIDAGLFGRSGGTIRNLNLFSSVGGSRRVGGLVAWSSGVISNCHVVSSVTGGSDNMGGLVGRLDTGGTVSLCSSAGTVLGTGSPQYTIGGLVGIIVVGGKVATSYSCGQVTGPGGGLIGFIGTGGGTIYSSYWDTNTSRRVSSSGGVGYSTTQMRQQASFTNWDFSGVWQITEGVTYPTLR